MKYEIIGWYKLLDLGIIFLNTNSAIMKSFEEKLYDEITESAKKEFDFDKFRKAFDLLDDEDAEVIADNLVWGLINRMIIDTPKEIIANILYNELLLIGFKLDLDSLREFISDKDTLFKKQIYVAKLASQMLNDGIEDIIVYKEMIQLL